MRNFKRKDSNIKSKVDVKPILSTSFKTIYYIHVNNNKFTIFYRTRQYNTTLYNIIRYEIQTLIKEHPLADEVPSVG